MMPALRRRCAVAAGMLLFVAAVALRAQDDAADLKRIVEALHVSAGSVVADVGAGPDGLLTLPIAHAVGAEGRVYASELGDSVRALRATVDKAGLRNVVVIDGDPLKTNLPPRCCDGIFIRNVYHHFADPPAMNASVAEALKPGGRLAILDFAPDGAEAPTPAERADGKTHGVTAQTVGRELTAAGFHVLSTDQTTKKGFIVVAEKSER